MSSNILFELNEIIKQAEKTLTYVRVFDVSGISEILEEYYVTADLMNKDYVALFYKVIEKFVATPLYKDLKINNEKDLKFISSEPSFKEEVEKAVTNIKSKLYPREGKLLKYFEKFEPKSDIKLEDIINSLKIDKTSLLFMLDNLKENYKIYDYNGREVTLK